MDDLTWATARRDIEVVRRLLAAGNISQKEKNTALRVAAHYKNLNIAKLLLMNDADPTIALPVAAGASLTDFYVSGKIGGNDEMVQLLIEAGADVTPETPPYLSHGDYAMINAVNNGRIQTVKLLLAAGATRRLPLSFYTSPAAILLGIKYGAEVPYSKQKELERYFDILNTVYYRELSQLILEYV